MLEIKNLKVVRGSFNVTLPELFIDDGECVALCGISGSGKSTLMEAIGLLTPALSVEQFVLDDIEVDMLSNGDSEALRISEVGIMPQTGGLLPYLTIRENLVLQIHLALRKKITPVFKNKQVSKPVPNTTVALQEAEERAAARRAAREATAEKASEDHSWLDTLNDECSVLDGANARSGTYIQLSNPHDQINARTGTVPEAVRKESRIPYIKGDDRYSRTLKISNESGNEQCANFMRSLEPHIERLGLAEHLDRRPDQLSIGQRQRALFLRSIAHKPRLLLIDEPTSSLDPDTAASLFRSIDEISQEARISVLLVTHDIGAASRYRRYIYDKNASYKEHSVFVAASDSGDRQRIPDGDGRFMSGHAIDFPAASNLSQKVHGGDGGDVDEDMRNTVYKSDEQGFHEIRAAGDSSRAGDVADELYRGYGGSYDQFNYSSAAGSHGKADDDLFRAGDAAVHGFGGRRKINDRVTHYTTSLENLQARLKRQSNSQDGHNVYGASLTEAGANLYTGAVHLPGSDYRGRTASTHITGQAAVSAIAAQSGTAMAGADLTADISAYAGPAGVGGPDGEAMVDPLQSRPGGGMADSDRSDLSESQSQQTGGRV
ncbi:ATP-binding cassette domain-containing protein [Anaerobiospirillum sp. NML120449]|uniref:ATP-binding cassette domain-containing protein n=1 Tax=Anaerobiospirillum sp. NML120449 TaxID=2932817 RepID=UPI001FF42AB4|nr:ATP-binding cassette domain-containing protein [Anaerobiospirillum sp. NML120449]MCK0525919.1 ATP-binding cassette domain-containing protein [Anaerobiospirillum sp. NML120449]